MRFAILGISHETNTFSIIPATYEQFERSGILRGQEVADRYATSDHTIAGYLQGAEELDFEAVLLMHARTGPIGTITKDAYDRLSTEMLGMLRDQGPCQGTSVRVEALPEREPVHDFEDVLREFGGDVRREQALGVGEHVIGAVRFHEMEIEEEAGPDVLL